MSARMHDSLQMTPPYLQSYMKVAATQLNSDLEIISQLAYQWKMQFSPDKNKQAIQVISFPEEG